VSDQQDTGRLQGMPHQFPAGIDDLVIVPLVGIAANLKKVLKTALSILIEIIDIAFPILLQVMRFPLFTLRIIGDGLAALLKGIVRLLPVGGVRRAAWREAIGEYWGWVRRKISYKAFEEALHHAFESGMAWVFRTCKALSPRTALLVLLGAILWLPISFGVATAMHAVLFAKALVWPAWMQLLHPVATVIAKSKLLVLPVYPAAWPQAKQHPIVQVLIRFWSWLTTLYLVRKTGYRFGQTEDVAADAADALGRTSAFVALCRFGNAVLFAINAIAAGIGQVTRTMAAYSFGVLSKVPLLGGIVRRYEAHYDTANRAPAVKVSDRTREFVQRWSVKFTAEYYEAKERKDAAGTSLAAKHKA
jgi:hypothetical protein